MSDITVEKGKKPDAETLRLSREWVALRGIPPKNIEQFRGREETLRGELALIGLEGKFNGRVFRTPDPALQSSFDQLTVGFENDSDAWKFRGAVQRLTEAKLAPGAWH